jgi:hypothetical protein
MSRIVLRLFSLLLDAPAATQQDRLEARFGTALIGVTALRDNVLRIRPGGRMAPRYRRPWGLFRPLAAQHSPPLS